MTMRIVSLITFFSLLFISAPSRAGELSVPVLYPQNNSIVGGKVNVVIDPGTDWSTIPFFQVVAGTTEYPPVDTSTGKHAFQGVDLAPGINTIIVKVLKPADEKGKKEKQPKFLEVSSREVKVFSMVELLTGRYAPSGFSQALFHSRENEAGCGGCHNMEAKADDPRPKKPEDAICYSCHRGIPAGAHIHGPVVVWNCLGCHDPEIYPVKYQFSAEDPWKVVKSFQSVVPVVFTIANDSLFKPGTAVFIPKTAEKGDRKGKEREKSDAKDDLKELLNPVLQQLASNPGDKVRVEAHTDNTPLPKPKGKQAKGFKDNAALSKARAAAVANALKQYGVTGKNRIISVGMGDKLPKMPNTTKEGRDQNSRVEIVVYPPDVKITNSTKLPVLKDRDRVMVSLSYAHGPSLNKLQVMDKLPAGSQYVKGTGSFSGKSSEPKIKGSELVWELGNPGQGFSGSLSYVIKKGKTATPPSEVVTVRYNTAADNVVSREFDPKKPFRPGHSVKETCGKCHPAMLSGNYKHGPADAGYCNLCHDPHGSPNAAWLRLPPFHLCITCHAEKAAGVHVLTGIVKGNTHPTHGRADPARPGKRLSCASCHEPHSAANNGLYSFEAKTRSELCGICHRKIK